MFQRGAQQDSGARVHTLFLWGVGDRALSPHPALAASCWQAPTAAWNITKAQAKADAADAAEAWKNVKAQMRADVGEAAAELRKAKAQAVVNVDEVAKWAKEVIVRAAVAKRTLWPGGPTPHVRRTPKEGGTPKSPGRSFGKKCVLPECDGQGRARLLSTDDTPPTTPRPH